MKEVESEGSTQSLLSVTDTALRLGMSRAFVYREIAAARLNAHRIGNRLRVTQLDLLQYVAQKKITNERIQAKRRHF